MERSIVGYDGSSDLLPLRPTSNVDTKRRLRKPAAKNKKKNKKNKNHAWRRHIPEGAVDPITLEPLESLPFPPFALVTGEPYVPVLSWPVGEDRIVKTRCEDQQEQEERQRRILQDQWGHHHIAVSSSPCSVNKPAQERTYNLYDGRALAIYMVSQLQFIDPLTRRGLTRDEVVHLDRYLQRHGFANVKVTEAFDVMGNTTVEHMGRAERLQQEARILLRTLFERIPSSPPALEPPLEDTNPKQEEEEEPPLLYPLGMRAAARQRRAQARKFPSLAESNLAAAANANGMVMLSKQTGKTKNVRTSRTLSHVTNAVQTKNRKQQELQWKAREDARKREFDQPRRPVWNSQN